MASGGSETSEVNFHELPFGTLCLTSGGQLMEKGVSTEWKQISGPDWLHPHLGTAGCNQYWVYTQAGHLVWKGARPMTMDLQWETRHLPREPGVGSPEWFIAPAESVTAGHWVPSPEVGLLAWDPGFTFEFAIPRAAPSCAHEWVETVGFSRMYKDCKHCKAKYEDVIGKY